MRAEQCKTCTQTKVNYLLNYFNIWAQHKKGIIYSCNLEHKRNLQPSPIIYTTTYEISLYPIVNMPTTVIKVTLTTMHQHGHKVFSIYQMKARKRSAAQHHYTRTHSHFYAYKRDTDEGSVGLLC